MYIHEKLIKDKIDFENKNNPGVMIGVDQYLETTYIEVPKYFTFSINRFEYNNGIKTKLNKNIPVSNDLIIDNDLISEKYKILTIIIHKGNAIGGHYYCYRVIWNDSNNSFDIYKLDDSFVSKVNLVDIKNDIEINGYIFLCEKL